MVYGHAVRILHNAAEAEDVVAEVFTEVWERAGSYRPERAKPVAWILALVKRRSIDCLRHRQSVLRAEVGLQRETEARGRGDGSRGVEEQVRLSDLRRSLEGMLERLPEAQRKTVELVFYGGMSQKEVARRTATPVGTVKTRLELALRKLRQAMREPPARSGGRVRQGSVF
jgi:RNA polymerase sigma-70 factor (ECF subfamily)